jgi:hypothetical protein
MINFRSNCMQMQEALEDSVLFCYLHVGYSDLFVARTKARIRRGIGGQRASGS